MSDTVTEQPKPDAAFDAADARWSEPTAPPTAVLAVGQDPPAPVEIPAGDFAIVCDLRARVSYALSQYNASHEDTKAKKKAYDAARETFELAFDRIVAKTRGEDLPLFNQTDQNEQAIRETNAKQLSDRLLSVAKIEVAPIVCAGWTEDEAMAVDGWLDDVESTPAGEAAPDPPKFILEPREVTATLDRETAKTIREMAEAPAPDETQAND